MRAITIGFCTRGEGRLNSDCSMDMWVFIDKEQGGGLGWEMTKRERQGDSGQTDLTRFLLKTGQGDRMSPGGWWRMKNDQIAWWG